MRRFFVAALAITLVLTLAITITTTAYAGDRPAGVPAEIKTPPPTGWGNNGKASPHFSKHFEEGWVGQSFINGRECWTYRPNPPRPQPDGRFGTWSYCKD